MRKLLAGLLVMVSSCAHMVPLDENSLDFYLTRHYAAGRAMCFEATVKSLGDMGVAISKKDPESGTIVTVRAKFGEMAYGTANFAHFVTSYHRFAIRVEGNDIGCTVRTTRYDVWNNNEKLWQVNADFMWPRVWQPFLDGIEENLWQP